MNPSMDAIAVFQSLLVLDKSITLPTPAPEARDSWLRLPPYRGECGLFYTVAVHRKTGRLTIPEQEEGRPPALCRIGCHLTTLQDVLDHMNAREEEILGLLLQRLAQRVGNGATPELLARALKDLQKRHLMYPWLNVREALRSGTVPELFPAAEGDSKAV